jgi:ATP-dependent DNA helicase RecQ
MAYGLADVVNHRRMIEESPAGEEFKQIQLRKLEALLALAEAADCRRVRLLAYFGEAREPPCGNCDNCLAPPERWDATVPAQKLLSCVYRIRQTGGRFGAGHVIDVLRGKLTEKVMSNRHQDLSTYGIGEDVSERHWRFVVRQLIALGFLRTETEWNTLTLTASSRDVLQGNVEILIRMPKAEAPKRSRPRPEAVALGDADQPRFDALRAWRGEVAREEKIAPFIVFHDKTLVAIAQQNPTSLMALGRVPGVGQKKLELYGDAILTVLAAQ